MRSREVVRLLGIPTATLYRLRVRLNFPLGGIGRDADWTGPQVAAAWVAWQLLDGNRPGVAAVACGRAAYRAWTQSVERAEEPPRSVVAALVGSRPTVAAVESPEAAWRSVAPLASQGWIVRYVRIPKEVVG